MIKGKIYEEIKKRFKKMVYCIFGNFGGPRQITAVVAVTSKTLLGGLNDLIFYGIAAMKRFVRLKEGSLFSNRPKNVFKTFG